VSSLEGKVAFISGVARGQGRSHALRLASLGADIVGIDICHDIPTMNYPNASAADLEQTADDVKALGRRMLAVEADVRDGAAVQAAVDQGYAEFGRLDIVLSNAGIVRLGDDPNDTGYGIWQDTLETNLTGGFHAVWATVPKLIEGGRGGVIILTGSTAGVRPVSNYTISAMRNALPIDILQPGDISDAVEFLVSDKAKWITGVSLPVDAGFSVR
jgi:NAD(P)-dependent dehydrogenase (short-subunit alcohol dehydrogenase family)